MPFQRLCRSSTLLVSAPQRFTIRSALPISRFYAKDIAATEADGASGKSPQEAQPKILNRKPPNQEDQGKAAQQHNENIEQRAERQNEKTDQEVKDDKVSKGFWGGEAGKGGV